jgi:hypothetical protein
MEYSQCSPSQQMQQQQQQQAQLNRDDSGSFAGMDDGWFSKCRCAHSRSPALRECRNGRSMQRMITSAVCHKMSAAESK